MEYSQLAFNIISEIDCLYLDKCNQCEMDTREEMIEYIDREIPTESSKIQSMVRMYLQRIKYIKLRDKQKMLIIKKQNYRKK